MKKFLINSLLIILIIGTIWILINHIETLNNRISIAESNTKALLLENQGLDSTSRVLQLTIDQLEYSKDSISKILLNTIKENNIKTDKIKQLEYAVMTNFRVDTVKFRDTIFVENTKLDTLITDNKWYKLALSLKYPNEIVVSPSFKNEIVTVFNYKKETIKPPKKCFIGRWFQKKHIVTETTIINNNPYSSTDTTRVIEIVNY